MFITVINIILAITFCAGILLLPVGASFTSLFSAELTCSYDNNYNSWDIENNNNNNNNNNKNYNFKKK